MPSRDRDTEREEKIKEREGDRKRERELEKRRWKGKPETEKLFNFHLNDCFANRAQTENCDNALRTISSSSAENKTTPSYTILTKKHTEYAQ